MHYNQMAPSETSLVAPYLLKIVHRVRFNYRSKKINIVKCIVPKQVIEIIQLI